ncbi:MAG TPA: hypothetical protein QGF50_16725 [Roseibacillus sp.]|nr:hypothetical protein [Roseibacillus sp.]
MFGLGDGIRQELLDLPGTGGIRAGLFPRRHLALGDAIVNQDPTPGRLLVGQIKIKFAEVEPSVCLRTIMAIRTMGFDERLQSLWYRGFQLRSKGQYAQHQGSCDQSADHGRDTSPRQPAPSIAEDSPAPIQLTACTAPCTLHP